LAKLTLELINRAGNVAEWHTVYCTSCREKLVQLCEHVTVRRAPHICPNPHQQNNVSTLKQSLHPYHWTLIDADNCLLYRPCHRLHSSQWRGVETNSAAYLWSAGSDFNDPVFSSERSFGQWLHGRSISTK